MYLEAFLFVLDLALQLAVDFLHYLALFAHLGIALLVGLALVCDYDYPNCTDSPPKQQVYDVVVTKLDAVGNGGASLISHINGSSDPEINHENSQTNG